MIIIKQNILVVCGRGKKRSKTAETLYRNDYRINIRSVGLGSTSNRMINKKDIEWANYILVMELKYKSRIIDDYEKQEIPKIFVLGVEDKYEYMDKELGDILKTKIEEVLKQIGL